jgi:hypothetical protein
MKSGKKKSRKIVRGTSSAVLLSVLIHAGLFLLAGMLVVFTVVRQKEAAFEPPKAVERPKMRLKKPQVRVRKSSRPKSTTRIVSKTARTAMPNMELPAMSGIGGELGGPIGGFDIMPDFGEVSVFGSGQSIGNDFLGTFYDFKRDRQGRGIPMEKEYFVNEVARLVRSGWDTSFLAKYHASARKLYATSIMVPATRSMLGPRAFGEQTGGWCWLVHYKGQLVYPEDIRFRFWGMGDDILVVRVNGKVVLNACWHEQGGQTYITTIGGSWDSSSADDARFWYGNNLARVGDWIDLKGGVPFDMEVIIGEVPGGTFSAMLTVQVEGETYERNRQGGPIVPMFKTTEPSRALQDIIYAELIQGEASVTNGPVFRDYSLPDTRAEEVRVAEAEEPAAPTVKTAWTDTGGKTFEAEYVTTIADRVILKSPDGKNIRIPMSSLSDGDREYLELSNPPAFDLEFVRSSRSSFNRYQPSPSEIEWGVLPPRVNDYTFSVKVKQTGNRAYPHELTVEYLAIGKELLGDNYILIDRQSGTFTPGIDNDGSYVLKGDPIEMIEYEYDGQQRGRRPSDSLVILKDKQGRIIEHKASKSWLWNHYESLKELPVGAYMDRTGRRAYPTSPKPTRW